METALGLNRKVAKDDTVLHILVLGADSILFCTQTASADLIKYFGLY